MIDWVTEFPGAVTVCDAAGTIVSMNNRAAEVFADDGGYTLIGRSVLDCHPEAARAKLAELLRTRGSTTYTIEKNGIKKIICQSPWYRNGSYAGIVELSIEIPFQVPHLVRNS